MHISQAKGGRKNVIIGYYDKIAAIKTDSRINFRIDKEKKTKFKELCEENGISVSGAIKLFMDDVIRANNMNKYFS